MVWSTGRTKDKSQTLESIQKRALRIISPGETYEDACVALRLPTLKEGRDTLCKSLFNVMLNANHRLHYMLQDKRQLITRAHPQYELPKYNTERYKNSFVSWCLFNCQENVVKY